MASLLERHFWNRNIINLKKSTMKNIKKILLLSFILCSSLVNFVNGQDLTLSELITLQSKDLDYVNNYLTKKKWDFNSSSVDTIAEYNKYTTVSWSYNKSDWGNKAQAWFYFYQQTGYENGIGYHTGKTNFNKIKNLVLNSGFKLVNTTALNEEIKSKYRNNKLEIVFTTSKYDNEEYSSSNDIAYFISMFNFKEIEEQILIEEKLEKQKKEEQLKREQELAIKEENYKKMIAKADSLLNIRSYSSSLQTYNEALLIKPNEYYPSNKISEINNTIAFLEERKIKIYDYKELNLADYNSVSSLISSKIKNTLSDNKIIGNSDFLLIYKVDTLGITTFSISENNSSNPEIINLIKPVIKDIQLKRVSKNEYFVFAKAEYNIKVTLDNQILDVKKNNVETIISNNPSNLYQNEVSKIISSGPIGKYKIQIQKREINSVDFSNNSILKYRGIGGPSNMFLSVLVPGLGVKNVTGGNKNGLSRTIASYGFILAGVGCKLWSNSEYDKYHSATEQSAMNEHYTSANILNKSFYVLTATGAIIWLYDIIWVANKGFKNKKEQKIFKQKLTVYYEPNNQYLGMTYKIKF